jgi:hypothetical protein
MDVIGDLVARERRTPARALRVDASGRSYTYHDFCTTAWKTGNFLRYLGVARGDVVAVAPDALPEPLLTLFGAALLGSVTRFDPGGDARAIVVHQSAESRFDPPPGTNLAVYGGPPSSPSVAHWEGVVWSENPAFPPTDVSPDAPALAAPETGDRYAHADLLSAARRVVDRVGIDGETTVAVRSSLARPETVVAGVLAPLSAGGTVVFPGDDTLCDVGVGDDPPEPVAVDPDSVLTA